MFIGFGTVLNITTVVVGASLGLVIGQRLSPTVRRTVTAALGLVTLLIAADSIIGPQVDTLVVLGSLVLGGLVGALVGIETWLERLGHVMRVRFSRGTEESRFVEGFVTSSLVFCVGPLTILGSINEGMGLGNDQLVLKSSLDAFASLAFAASLGIGVLFSAFTVGIVQGSLTLVGVALGQVLSGPAIDTVTVVGGLILVGVSLRLLELGEPPVADLLPALILAPALVEIVAAVG